MIFHFYWCVYLVMRICGVYNRRVLGSTQRILIFSMSFLSQQDIGNKRSLIGDVIRFLTPRCPISQSYDSNLRQTILQKGSLFKIPTGGQWWPSRVVLSSQNWSDLIPADLNVERALNHCATEPKVHSTFITDGCRQCRLITEWGGYWLPLSYARPSVALAE